MKHALLSLAVAVTACTSTSGEKPVGDISLIKRDLDSASCSGGLGKDDAGELAPFDRLNVPIQLCSGRISVFYVDNKAGDALTLSVGPGGAAFEMSVLDKNFTTQGHTAVGPQKLALLKLDFEERTRLYISVQSDTRQRLPIKVLYDPKRLDIKLDPATGGALP